MTSYLKIEISEKYFNINRGYNKLLSVISKKPSVKETVAIDKKKFLS